MSNFLRSESHLIHVPFRGFKSKYFKFFNNLGTFYCYKIKMVEYHISAHAYKSIPQKLAG